MISYPRGSKLNPCKNRREAIILAKQDARVGGSCLFVIKEKYDFIRLGKIDVPILSKIYRTESSYISKENGETKVIRHVAIQDHFLGHLFKGGDNELPHIHATKIEHLKTVNGKPADGTVVSRHERMANCQLHYYYLEQEMEELSDVEEPYEQPRASLIQEWRIKRNNLEDWNVVEMKEEKEKREDISPPRVLSSYKKGVKSHKKRNFLAD